MANLSTFELTESVYWWQTP